ncbi:RNA-guided endonuclease InsQ/TnpB family protein [Saccharomonospora iraqiensis]|uniref:RNA-guided endonuclease InsQ/TnpB family protein n=1 Tax=Saccharomonospora iraqiensis TaxID=52698 RepID=UPI00022DED0B|nr:RNA-guided endonuclease TnpB family protein [Saccharomonospora iraqiensis]
MLAGRKYRSKLTTEQAAQCEEFGNVCRAVWNTALDQRRQYRTRGAWMNYNEQAGQLADAKTEHEWLKVAPSHILQQTLKDLDRACKDHGTFRVKWRGKSRWNPSFRFPMGKLIEVERLSKRWGRAKLPKLGWVRFRMTRQIGGVVRSATVSHDGRDWFVSFLVDDGEKTPEQHAMPDTGVGVDRGVVAAVATSDGKLIDRGFTSPGEAERYRRLQQELARQKRGSRNRKKTLRAMRGWKRREGDRRADFCSQVAAELTDRNALVALEDLRTRNMTRSASGTSEEPGRSVARKSGLNRAILDKGWHKLELALLNAARHTGSEIVKVPAAYTSQACSVCRNVDPDNRNSQAVFRCTGCGHTAHADVNAAINVLAAGRAVTACGDLGAGRSVKQEPQPALALVGIPRLQPWGGRQATMTL